MRLNWHPSDNLLADYAAGALAKGWSLAIAAHLAMCPDCRADTIALDAIGGGALESLPADPSQIQPSTTPRPLFKAPGRPPPIPRSCPPHWQGM